MKRLFCAFAAILLSAGLFAQTKYKPEISIGYGGMPFWEMLVYGSNYDIYPDLYYTLDNLYGSDKGKVISTGVISLQADFPFKKWFSLPVTVAGVINTTKVYDSLYDRYGHKYSGGLHILAGAKFRYANKKHFNMYSSVNAGLCMLAYSDDSPDLLFDFEVVPVGFRVKGEHLFGYAEVGVGSFYIGGMVGIGYIF